MTEFSFCLLYEPLDSSDTEFTGESSKDSETRPERGPHLAAGSSLRVAETGSWTRVATRSSGLPWPSANRKQGRSLTPHRPPYHHKAHSVLTLGSNRG